MSDGFEDQTNTDPSSDYGFVGEDGGERAPGNGWESDPTPYFGKGKVTSRRRLRPVFQQIVESFNRR